MKLKTTIAIGGLFLIAGQAALACDYPERPAIPDGATATKEDMLAAKDAVTAYLAGVDEYLVCIETEEKDAIAALDNPGEDELKRRDELLNKKFDAANEEKALIGEQFNVQVRAYNTARSSQ
jgi:hypothetical protein